MKTTLNKLNQFANKIEDVDMRLEIQEIYRSIQSAHQIVSRKLEDTTKESIGRKEKLSKVYQKVNDYDDLVRKLQIKDNQLQSLRKYQEKAVQEKKMVNDKIKTLFQQQLSNQNSKEYQKYERLATQFDFQNQSQQVYNRNKKNYDLLQLAGTFGNQSIINLETLPKSAGGGKQTKGR